MKPFFNSGFHVPSVFRLPGQCCSPGEAALPTRKDAPVSLASVAASPRPMRQAPSALQTGVGGGLHHPDHAAALFAPLRCAADLRPDRVVPAMSNAFTERLKELTTDVGRGWQADLARRCGVTRPAITNWLSGRNKGIESTHLFAIADYFRVHPRWLATGAGPKWVEVPMQLSKNVHPNVGEVLVKFEEVAARHKKMSESERIELYIWLAGERLSAEAAAGPQPTD
ncbi:helix-turn-helix domain-containing protein [Variovorax paradoxus]|uniref:helix-turn-helix domain-containing protein n=1 Tax=Variovorax paradoxus TaxID=34073 RepID=UPI0021AD3305|nr:helix-turn-helix transcriptional regulator [Variovorax paradoxus]UVH60636.1 helix-turn-helix domain-containing protein [Variovorax paradoxus]